MKQVSLGVFLLLWSGCLMALADEGRVAYVGPDGLYVRGVPAGETRRVAGGAVSSPTWSPSGEWLAYVADTPPYARLYHWTDGDMVTLPAAYNLTWSPVDDVFVYAKPDGGLYKQQAGGWRERMLLPGGAGATIDRICWRADGRQLAYVVEWARLVDGIYRRHDEVWVMAADGSGRQRVRDAGQDTYRPVLLDWTPDGRELLLLRDEAYSASVLADDVPLLAMAIPRGTTRTLAPAVLFAEGQRVSPAPDSRAIAIAAGAGREDWHGKSVRVAPREGVARRLSPAGVNITGVAWSPDGRALACVAAPAAPEAARLPEITTAVNARRIVLTPPTRWRPCPLRDGSPYREEYPQWSRDGNHLLVVRVEPATQTASLWRIAADGSQARQVVASLGPSPGEGPERLGFYGKYVWSTSLAWWQGPPIRTAATAGLLAGGTAWLPIRATVEALDGTVTVDRRGRITCQLHHQTYPLPPELPIWRQHGSSYAPARLLAAILGGETTPLNDRLVVLSMGRGRRSARILLQPSPALAQRAAAYAPILVGTHLLGGVSRRGFVGSSHAALAATAVQQYRQFRLTGPCGQWRAGGLEFEALGSGFHLGWPPDSGPGFDTISVTSPRAGMPCLPRRVSLSAPRVRRLAQTILQQQGLAAVRPHLTQAYAVPLAQGAAPALIISATTPSPAYREVTVRPGDYSFVAVEINGTSCLLDGEFYPRVHGSPYPGIHTLLNVLDLDGDGTSEVVTNTQYYEELASTVYRLQAVKFIPVLRE
jgi:hypothetical protein